MDNPKTEETTHSDPSEPIVSWSGVQGETQAETQSVETPNQDELEASPQNDDEKEE